MKNRLPFNVLLFLLVMAVMAGCANTFTANAYRGLSVSKEFRETALAALGDLYRQGRIDEETKAAAIQIGDAYAAAHQVAVSALAVYEASRTEENRRLFEVAMQEVTRLYAVFSEFVMPVLTRGDEIFSMKGVEDGSAIYFGDCPVGRETRDSGGSGDYCRLAGGESEHRRYSSVRRDETGGQLLRGARWMNAIALGNRARIV